MVAKSKSKAGRKQAQVKAAGGVLGIAVAAVVVYAVWFVFASQQAAHTAYDAAVKASQSEVVNAHRPNIVQNDGNAPADLVALLRNQETGCHGEAGQGWFRVVKEVNGTQATIEYGCSNSYRGDVGLPSRMLAHKVNGAWELISPDNQWAFTVPSCAMLQANDIVATLEPQCWSKRSSDGILTVIPNDINVLTDGYAACVQAPGSVVLLSYPPVCVTKDGVSYPQ